MRRPLLHWVDLPPLWLALALAVVWGFDQLMPWGLFGPAGRGVGAALVVLGVAIMAGAAAQMLAARTTVVPRGQPRVLVTAGLLGWLGMQSEIRSCWITWLVGWQREKLQKEK